MNEYQTKSLVLASTLICLGFPLNSSLQSPNGRAIFIFARTEELDPLLESFWKKDLRVEPNSFFEAMRFLKSKIYGDGNG